MFSLLSVMEAAFLVTALSTDAFISGFAYGTDKIKIPFLSVTVINVVCSSILGVSLLIGAVVRPFIPERAAAIICFIILLVLGLSKIFDSTLKSLIKKYSDIGKNLKFELFSLHFILHIYANPEDADIDRSSVLSPAEAAYLAVALSLDGLAVGFGTGLTHASPVLIVFFSFISGMLAVILGCRIGNKIAEKITSNLAWLSGAILVILAFTKL